MGVKDRLLDDAKSFAKEVASLDVDGFTSRTLEILGLANDSDTVTETGEEDIPRGPAASSGQPPAGPTPDLFVKYPAPAEPGVLRPDTGTAHPDPRPRDGSSSDSGTAKDRS